MRTQAESTTVAPFTVRLVGTQPHSQIRHLTNAELLARAAKVVKNRFDGKFVTCKCEEGHADVDVTIDIETLDLLYRVRSCCMDRYRKIVELLGKPVPQTYGAPIRASLIGM